MIVKVSSEILSLLEHMLTFDEAHISWRFAKYWWRIFDMLWFFIRYFLFWRKGTFLLILLLLLRVCH